MTLSELNQQKDNILNSYKESYKNTQNIINDLVDNILEMNMKIDDLTAEIELLKS